MMQQNVIVKRCVHTLMYLLVPTIVLLRVAPFWVALVAFCLSVILGPKAAVDRLILLTAVALGIVPVFGWYATPSWVNPIKVLVVLFVFDILRSMKWLHRDAVGDIISIAPGFSVGIFTYQWWNGLSKGSPTDVLERLLPIWDFSAHFNFFYSNLVNRTYLSRASTTGLTSDWFGREYPSGVHYVLGQFVNDQRTHLIANPQDAIPVFANSIVLMFAFSVFICSVCGWRLANNSSLRFSFAALGAGISVALISIGPLSQTISTGFANMPAVLIPLVILVSIHFRPLGTSTTQLLTFCACVGAIAYNWYPALLLIFPLVILEIGRISDPHKIFKRSSIFVVMIFLIMPPILQTFSLGLNHLDMTGGIQPFPPGRLTFILLASFSVALVSLMSSANSSKYFWANIVPLPFAVSFAIWLQMRSQGYNYYFQKFMLFVAAFAAITALFTFFSFLTENEKHLKFEGMRRYFLVSFASCAIALGLSQTLGYWGPDYPEFAGSTSAYGVLYRNEITKREQRHLENAEQILRMLDNTRRIETPEKERILLFVPVNSEDPSSINYGPSISLLTNVWFHSLSRSNTDNAQLVSSAIVNFSSFSDANQIAESIARIFDPDSVRVYSSEEVIRELQKGSNRWSLHSL